VSPLQPHTGLERAEQACGRGTHTPVVFASGQRSEAQTCVAAHTLPVPPAHVANRERASSATPLPSDGEAFACAARLSPDGEAFALQPPMLPNESNPPQTTPNIVTPDAILNDMRFHPLLTRKGCEPRFRDAASGHAQSVSRSPKHERVSWENRESSGNFRADAKSHSPQSSQALSCRTVMAGIDIGAPSARRALNRELTLVPFSDFLLCIVAFLLVTAVWSQMARVEASASAPGKVSTLLPAEEPVLHVDMRSEDHFVLSWRTGDTVIDEATVLRKATAGGLAFPVLASAVVEGWTRRGSHRGATDAAHDRAILHAANSAPFEDVIAVIDAIHSVDKPSERRGPAFDVVFAVD